MVFLFCATSFGIMLIMGGARYSTLETEIYRQTVDMLDLRDRGGAVDRPGRCW